MEASLITLAAQKVSLPWACCSVQDALVVWEAACHWKDAVEALKPAQVQEQLLRFVLLSLLACIVSDLESMKGLAPPPTPHSWCTTGGALAWVPQIPSASRLS